MERKLGWENYFAGDNDFLQAKNYYMYIDYVYCSVNIRTPDNKVTLLRGLMSKANVFIKVSGLHSGLRNVTPCSLEEVSPL